MSLIIPFLSHTTLAESGGKGANLARLTRAGFRVPPGFILSTDAYRSFVAASRLDEVIQSALDDLLVAEELSTGALEAASVRIREAFERSPLPGEIAGPLREEFHRLGGGAVAVRSSATAEDLPDLSFAGQQDTFLNVQGEEQLLTAVRRCWSSLWTARAIGYRVRSGIPHAGAALAVVVQAMVVSEISGVLFTANPLSGQLNQSVIDATIGLGEALVSGQVEPDQYIVDSRTAKVLSQRLGAKHAATRPLPGGGVETVRFEGKGLQSLSSVQAQTLVEVGQRIQDEYGAPQDIEWAYAGSDLYILQARAITSLFPVPRVSFDPLDIWFSFGAVQGVVGPITPLGRDSIRWVFVNGAKLFHARPDPERLSILVEAGERLWIKISDMIRSSFGLRVQRFALDYVEPGAAEVVRRLAEESGIRAGSGKLRLVTRMRMVFFLLPIAARMLRTFLAPEWARRHIDQVIEERIRSSEVKPAGDPFQKIANVADFLRNDSVAAALPFILPRFVPVFGPAMASLSILTRLSGDMNLALEVTRGMPHNVTTEMDQALWRTARAILADAESEALFRAAEPANLARRCLAGSLPAAAQQALERFLDRYGMRGVGEIDFGQPRWREDPTPVMHTLKSYMEIDPQSAPDVQFARGEQAAQEAVERIAAIVRRQRGGWIKEHIVRVAAKRIRLLMGVRESPKFFAIRLMGKARAVLLDAARELTALGVIDHPDDLVFLRISELEQMARREPRDWPALVSERRAAYNREMRRRQVPRILVSDGRAFYEGVGALDAHSDEDEIIGSPVSAGIVEGVVHVVFDPRSTSLAPGEIMVCPGTDPAWTPLFMVAAGLITEVGGMMTHGSVVAREYGIPAVVGVHAATTRLKDGQRIRLDGTRGMILLLE